MNRTRRQILQAGGAAGAGALAALAGCSGLIGGGGDGSTGTTTDGETDPTTTATTTAGTTTTAGGSGAATYREWLPAPQALGGDDRYLVNYYDAAAFQSAAVSNAAVDRVRQAVDSPAQVLGVDAASVETLLQVGTAGTRVVTGTFGADGVGSALTGAGYQRGEEYSNFRLYTGGKDPAIVALRDGIALLCRRSGSNDARQVAQLLVDASGGKATRFHQASDAFAAATESTVGAAHAAGGTIPRRQQTDPARGYFEGQVAFGVGVDLRGGTARLRYVRAFDDPSLANPDPVRTWATEHSPGLASYQDVSVTAQGRTVTVTGSIPIDQFDFLQSGDP